MLANLRAGFARNKKTLAIVGAVAVAGVAFVARKRASSSTSSTTNTSTTSTTATTGTSSSPYSTYTPYDSTASDISNALQANTEAMQQLLASIPTPDPNAVATPATTTPVTPAATTPAATTPAAAAPAPLVNMGLVKNPNNATIYERRSDNSLRAIPYAEWSGAGFPGFNVVAASDPLWTSAKYV